MDILFVHHSIPSQYHNLINRLRERKEIRLCTLGFQRSSQQLDSTVPFHRYTIERGNGQGTSWLAVEFESKMIRAEACAQKALKLRDKGLKPDLICAHPGWGEALLLRDIWPNAPMITYQEFSYNSRASDLDFDNEFEQVVTWRERARCRTKQANVLLGLDASSWCVTPTHFQKSTFPSVYQKQISVIHDGINCQVAIPDSDPQPLTLASGMKLLKGMPIVTFVSRCLEPYRGIHSFLRAVPAIHRQNPEAQIVIVGQEEGVSYGSPCPFAPSWKDHLLNEISGQYDPERLHFLGSVPHAQFIQLMQLSAAHVYLTYPFVLSWSLLEAMACGCAVVGSATAPVQEVIQDGHNGLLVDFFSPSAIASAVLDLLAHAEHTEKMRYHARQTVLEHYSLNRCLPQHLALIELVRNGTLRADG